MPKTAAARVNNRKTCSSPIKIADALSKKFTFVKIFCRKRHSLLDLQRYSAYHCSGHRARVFFSNVCMPRSMPDLAIPGRQYGANSLSMYLSGELEPEPGGGVPASQIRRCFGHSHIFVSFLGVPSAPVQRRRCKGVGKNSPRREGCPGLTASPFRPGTCPRPVVRFAGFLLCKFAAAA